MKREVRNIAGSLALDMRSFEWHPERCTTAADGGVAVFELGIGMSDRKLHW